MSPSWWVAISAVSPVWPAWACCVFSCSVLLGYHGQLTLPLQAFMEVTLSEMACENGQGWCRLQPCADFKMLHSFKRMGFCQPLPAGTLNLWLFASCHVTLNITKIIWLLHFKLLEWFWSQWQWTVDVKILVLTWRDFRLHSYGTLISLCYRAYLWELSLFVYFSVSPLNNRCSINV